MTDDGSMLCLTVLSFLTTIDDSRGSLTPLSLMSCAAIHLPKIISAGVTIKTLRLERLSKAKALAFVQAKLARKNKHVSSRLLSVLVAKTDGTLVQYLSLATMLMADMWGYEQVRCGWKEVYRNVTDRLVTRHPVCCCISRA